MTQLEINAAVAAVTGEAASLIDTLGFGIADPDDVRYDPEPHRPQVFDWDSASPIDWPG